MYTAIIPILLGMAYLSALVCTVGFEPPNYRQGVKSQGGVTRRSRWSASMMQDAGTPLPRMRGVSINQLPLGFKIK